VFGGPQTNFAEKEDKEEIEEGGRTIKEVTLIIVAIISVLFICCISQVMVKVVIYKPYLI
jgi:hypothetical protein